jgi:hypothetical protein
VNKNSIFPRFSETNKDIQSLFSVIFNWEFGFPYATDITAVAEAPFALGLGSLMITEGAEE